MQLYIGSILSAGCMRLECRSPYEDIIDKLITQTKYILIQRTGIVIMNGK